MWVQAGEEGKAKGSRGARKQRSEGAGVPVGTAPVPAGLLPSQHGARHQSGIGQPPRDPGNGLPLPPGLLSAGLPGWNVTTVATSE